MSRRLTAAQEAARERVAMDPHAEFMANLGPAVPTIEVPADLADVDDGFDRLRLEMPVVEVVGGRDTDGEPVLAITVLSGRCYYVRGTMTYEAPSTPA